MPRYPAGASRVGDLSLPDGLLEELQAEIRRDRDPHAPPPEVEADPLLVPRALFLQAMSSGIMREANALGIRQDAETLAFNSRVEGARQERLAQLNADAALRRALSQDLFFPPDLGLEGDFNAVNILGWERSASDQPRRLIVSGVRTGLLDAGIAEHVVDYVLFASPWADAFDRRTGGLEPEERITAIRESLRPAIGTDHPSQQGRRQAARLLTGTEVDPILETLGFTFQALEFASSGEVFLRTVSGGRIDISGLPSRCGSSSTSGSRQPRS